MTLLGNVEAYFEKVGNFSFKPSRLSLLSPWYSDIYRWFKNNLW